MLASSWTESVGAPFKVLFVDLVENCHHRMLNDFVFQGSHAQGTLSSICFGNIGSLGRLRSIGPSLYLAMQICQPLVEIRLVLLPRHPIYSWCSVTLQRIEAVQ